MSYLLLSPSSSNPKTKKSIGKGYLTPILYLAPYNESGCMNVCPSSTAHCRKLCLYHCGHGGIIDKKTQTNHIRRVRITKTRMFHHDRQRFLQELNLDIELAKKKATKKGLKLAIRLNGTSDIPFEDLPLANGRSLMDTHNDTQFYDYTKVVKRLRKRRPKNYYLMLSYSGSNKKECVRALEDGFNVAVIFKKGLPETLWGYKVIDGDKDDLRFLDPKGVVVGLRAKGPARTANNKMIL